MSVTRVRGPEDAPCAGDDWRPGLPARRHSSRSSAWIQGCWETLLAIRAPRTARTRGRSRLTGT